MSMDQISRSSSVDGVKLRGSKSRSLAFIASGCIVNLHVCKECILYWVGQDLQVI